MLSNLFFQLLRDSTGCSVIPATSWILVFKTRKTVYLAYFLRHFNKILNLLIKLVLLFVINRVAALSLDDAL